MCLLSFLVSAFCFCSVDIFIFFFIFSPCLLLPGCLDSSSCSSKSLHPLRKWHEELSLHTSLWQGNKHLPPVSKHLLMVSGQSVFQFASFFCFLGFTSSLFSLFLTSPIEFPGSHLFFPFSSLLSKTSV